MPILNHLVILTSYALVAGAVGATLPHHIEAIDRLLAAELGFAFLFACLFAHFAITRFARDRALANEFALLKLNNEETRAELVRAREEARRVLESIDNAIRARQGHITDIETVMTEVKVLQDLVEQLSQGREMPVARPTKIAAEGGARAARPAAPATPRVMTGADDATLLEIVREGLRNNRVDLFVQPIVSLPQRKHRHYECFSRIRAADGSMVTPEQYLAIAEREGLIGAIDNMLLFRSLQLVRKIQKRENVGLFLNISEHTLADADFFREFVAFLAGNRELSPRLVFEFAQAHVERHGASVMLELERLARLGFRFSMDQVTHLNLDLDALGARHFRFIKLDAAKLLEHTRSETERLDMRAFKRALDRNGIDLIVEKIETEPMVLELLDLPVDYGQGFLFGEPRQAKDG
ncbi:MAG TPA: EAL domain-containing protein [Alphaproteobacteria bacterium]|nr:EAL domain-containing protein [Alphaproteobacteria bacterium]